jgi:RNA repair pathway DNA polymerase beta family protein
MMDLIVEMRFGSQLYGTATPLSDLDYKAVYLPEVRDILLQRISATVSLSRDKAAGEKNLPGDVDHEIYSLQRYLELLAEGQTVALDMLFAPDWAMPRSPSPLWREIQANTPRLLTRRASAFVRYCRQQANKYGIKGSRAAVAREALAILTTAETTYGAAAKLAEAAAEVTAFAAVADHTALLDVPLPGDKLVRHLEVCGKRMPFTSSIKNAREIVQRLVEEYGQRALQAARNEGVDWKALSHAVRVGREALELFETGRISFPLPYAAEILSIKRGERPYEAVAETIEGLLVSVEAAATTSSLPEQPDQGFIDDLVARAYRGKILEAT